MDFKTVEAKWQKVWEERGDLFRAYDSDSEYEKAKGKAPKGKKYVLVEFPYPSGTGLHIGHAFSFTAGDIYARYLRLSGYNVLFPMGWDAFGLPTENFAIKTKRKPQDITMEQTDKFKGQMNTLALSFDWERELFTTDPQFYKWTQWIFIKLWEKGLAEKQKMPINWCPSCKIGLANEEVVDGKCERCGSGVEKREIEQWVVKITAYADRLAEGLKDTDFIEKVKASQINWIGKKEGVIALFKAENSEVIKCFTKYPETIFGVTWLVVAPEYPGLEKFVTNEQKEAVEKYVNGAKNKSEFDRVEMQKDKSGVFTGGYAVNPVNGKRIQIWVADYVLANFGTGAVMGVAMHDKRDFDFAKKYNLEMIQVEIPEEKEEYIIDSADKVIEDGIMVNSGKFDGLKARQEAFGKISDWMVENGWAEKKIEYHLRDWIFSRQHYWGEPVPMWRSNSVIAKSEAIKQSNVTDRHVATRDDGTQWQSVPESELPVVLPEVDQYEPTDDGKSPLAKIAEFVKYRDGERDTDTMPNWAGSDWYFVGYLMKEVYKNLKIKNENLKKEENVFLKNAEKLKYWLPVDVYLGGDEHNTLHLLYSRFIYQFLYDLGMVPTPEPYYRRVSHGVILAPDGRRMSKSKGNTIDPIPLCEEFGVDVIRTSMMFMGPFDATMPWNPNTVSGVKRFLDRLEKWVLAQIATSHGVHRDSRNDGQMYQSILNKTIKSISEDLAVCKFNTPVAKLMSLLNEVEDKNMSYFDIDKLLVILSIYAPYLAEELWKEVGHKDSVHEQTYPEFDEALIVSDMVMIPVCINGKKRGEVEVAKNDKAVEVVAKWLEGKEVVRTVYIENKMVNLVVR